MSRRGLARRSEPDSDFFDEAPMPWLNDSISSSRSSPVSSSTGWYDPVSS